jgi:hypothetical protein
MAIDTEIKRKSIAAIANPWNGPVIVPDNTIDNPDRQAIGWSYAGIAAINPGQVFFSRYYYDMLLARQGVR